MYQAYLLVSSESLSLSVADFLVRGPLADSVSLEASGLGASGRFFAVVTISFAWQKHVYIEIAARVRANTERKEREE